MIAPIKEPETSGSTPSMRRARRMIADSLLGRETSSNDGPPVAAWKAWLFAGWVTAVVAIYFAYMVGWF